MCVCDCITKEEGTSSDFCWSHDTVEMCLMKFCRTVNTIKSSSGLSTLVTEREGAMEGGREGRGDLSDNMDG